MFCMGPVLMQSLQSNSLNFEKYQSGKFLEQHISAIKNTATPEIIPEANVLFVRQNLIIQIRNVCSTFNSQNSLAPPFTNWKK